MTEFEEECYAMEVLNAAKAKGKKATPNSDCYYHSERSGYHSRKAAY